MASFTEAVQRITIESRTQGVIESTQQVKQLGQAQNDLAQISGRVETATGWQEVALLRSAKAAQLYQQQTQQLTAANDNASRSWQAANDNMKTVGSSFLSTAESIVTTTAHLKLAALAAYALSPAFRSIANTGIANTIAFIGPAAASAASTILSALVPALSFLSRIALPIGIAVAAWKLLNSVISTGSGLLEKYGNAGRSLFAAGVDEKLKELTKFQNDTISLEQVQRATELGARLTEAKKTISDFFSVQFDLTDPALKLQSVWVGIVELIAKAVSGLQSLLDLFGKIPGALPALNSASGIAGQLNPITAPFYNLLQLGSSAPGQEPSRADLFNLGRQRLIGAMGGGFAGRFSGDILAKPKDEDTKKTTGEFDRLVDSINRATAAQEANIQTVDKSVGEQARLRTEFRLTEAAQQDIAKHGGDVSDYYDRIQKAAQRAGEAAQALERARVASSINRDRQTAFLTPEDVQIAQQLRGLYGDDIPAALASAEAAAMRFNKTLSDIGELGRGTLVSFAQDFNRELRQGATAWQAFNAAALSALSKIEDKLIEMAINQLWSQAFGGRGGGGFNLFSLFGGGGGGAAASGPPPSFSAFGNVFSGGRIQPYAMGGIVTGPTLFPMANGAGLMGEAGPEAVMPLKRGPDGRLGVASSGRGGAPIIIHNYGADVQAQQNDDGSTELTVRALHRDEMASSRTNGINKAKYGLNPQLRQRRG